jgi:CRISPR system Cascade subunit CasE
VTLHIVKLVPDMLCAAAFERDRRYAPLGSDQGYLWHVLLTAAFGVQAPKPWRLMEPNNGPNPNVESSQLQKPLHLLAYSAAGKAELLGAFARQCADRDAGFRAIAAKSALALETLEVKPMPANFRSGQRLGFELRLRPVTRSSMMLGAKGELAGRSGRDGRIEIDVAYHAALAAREANSAAPKPDAESVYRDWLATRLRAGGARLDATSARMMWRKRARIVRRDASRVLAPHGAKGGGPDIGFCGALTIEDPAAFATLLAQGVGRHRAFGFGMLLLRPAE